MTQPKLAKNRAIKLFTALPILLLLSPHQVTTRKCTKAEAKYGFSECDSFTQTRSGKRWNERLRMMLNNDIFKFISFENWINLTCSIFLLWACQRARGLWWIFWTSLKQNWSIKVRCSLLSRLIPWLESRYIDFTLQSLSREHIQFARRSINWWSDGRLGSHLAVDGSGRELHSSWLWLLLPERWLWVGGERQVHFLDSNKQIY